jgi:Concanavalin A-like lectin/glucanases superfamily
MIKTIIIGAIAVWAGSAIAADLPIIAHWSFDKDQGATVLLDSSANKLNVPLVPVKAGEKIKTVKGVIGQALELTGKEKAVFSITNKKLNLKVPFSIACWVKIKNKQQSNNSIFVNAWDSGKKGYRMHASWRMVYYRWGNGKKMHSTSTKYGSILRDKWYHLTVTNDGKAIKMYINGSLAKSLTGDNLQPVANTGRCGIGNYFGSKAHRFIGLMDELYIFGKALTEDEVFDLAIKQDAKSPKAK